MSLGFHGGSPGYATQQVDGVRGTLYEHGIVEQALNLIHVLGINLAVVACFPGRCSKSRYVVIRMISSCVVDFELPTKKSISL